MREETPRVGRGGLWLVENGAEKIPNRHMTLDHGSVEKIACIPLAACTTRVNIMKTNDEKPSSSLLKLRD